MQLCQVAVQIKWFKINKYFNIKHTFWIESQWGVEVLVRWRIRCLIRVSDPRKGFRRLKQEVRRIEKSLRDLNE